MKKGARIIFTFIVSALLAMAFCTAVSAAGEVYNEDGIIKVTDLDIIKSGYGQAYQD